MIQFKILANLITAMLSNMEQVQGLHRKTYKQMSASYILSQYLQIWPTKQFPKTPESLDYIDNSHHNVQGIERTIKSLKYPTLAGV